MLKLIILLTFSFPVFATFESFPSQVTERTPVYFALHGCKQNAQIFLEDAFLVQKAKEKAVIYAPSQPIFRNSDHCWNWFMPINQIPTAFSETATMVLKFKQFLLKNGLQNNPAYLLGMSAGAAQTMNLLACYPQMFQGAVISAGLPYRVTDKVIDIADVIAYGPKKRAEKMIKDFALCSPSNKSFMGKKFIFVHGEDDIRVSMKNFVALRSQFIGAFDYRDDFRLNSSIPLTITVENRKPPGKYPYELTYYEIKQSTKVWFYRVHGLRHDWSGGPYRIERNDPMGPELTDTVLTLFR